MLPQDRSRSRVEIEDYLIKRVKTTTLHKSATLIPYLMSARGRYMIRYIDRSVTAYGFATLGYIQSQEGALLYLCSRIGIARRPFRSLDARTSQQGERSPRVFLHDSRVGASFEETASLCFCPP